MTTLRDRCNQFISERHRTDSDDLLGFVLSEKGRDADPSLADTLPLVLYFGNDADRDEFLAMLREYKPNMTARKLP